MQRGAHRSVSSCESDSVGALGIKFSARQRGHRIDRLAHSERQFGQARNRSNTQPFGPGNRTFLGNPLGTVQDAPTRTAGFGHVALLSFCARPVRLSTGAGSGAVEHTRAYASKNAVRWTAALLGAGVHCGGPGYVLDLCSVHRDDSADPLGTLPSIGPWSCGQQFSKRLGWDESPPRRIA